MIPGRPTPCFAEIEESVVRPLSEAPWLGGVRTGAEVPLAEVRLVEPVQPSKIVGVGRNYREHILEMGYATPTSPTVFLKPPSALVGPDGEVVLPPRRISTQVEHEAELGVVIGQVASAVPVERALDYVFGYTCCDDVSARDLQRSDATLARGKGWNTFCPVGPWIATGVEVDRGLTVECVVNGELRQRGNTADMVFGVAEIVAHVSSFMTLVPGDLVLTGSPGGTASMEPGDSVEIRIDGVGVLRHGVAADPDDRQAMPWTGGSV